MTGSSSVCKCLTQSLTYSNSCLMSSLFKHKQAAFHQSLVRPTLSFFCPAGVSLHVACGTLRIPCSDTPALPGGMAEFQHLSHCALPHAALPERNAWRHVWGRHKYGTFWWILHMWSRRFNWDRVRETDPCGAAGIKMIILACKRF